MWRFVENKIYFNAEQPRPPQRNYPLLPNIANKFAKTAKPFGTRVPLTLRYALAIPSVSRSVGLTFLTSPATGTKKSKLN